LRLVAYSLNDNAGDEFMIRFDMNRVPPYTFAVLRDMMGINSLLKFHLNPWSPVSLPSSAPVTVMLIVLQPAWMKTNMTMNGGSLQERYIPACTHLVQCQIFEHEADHADQMHATFSKLFRVSEREVFQFTRYLSRHVLAYFPMSCEILTDYLPERTPEQQPDVPNVLDVA
jgi:hypothetical protein